MLYAHSWHDAGYLAWSLGRPLAGAYLAEGTRESLARESVAGRALGSGRTCAQGMDVRAL